LIFKNKEQTGISGDVTFKSGAEVVCGGASPWDVLGRLRVGVHMPKVGVMLRSISGIRQ
jgi:hypothetical protein